MARIDFPYPGIAGADIPDANLTAILEPRATPPAAEDDTAEVRRAMSSPIGTPRLRDMAPRGGSVLILIDDNTRNTPADRILPLLLEELEQSGVAPKDVTIMIALGTHRPMTREETERKVGRAILETCRIVEHRWDRPDGLVRLDDTEGGTEVWVNKILLSSDLVIGLGHITPHRVAGFSGGSKIVQPGVSGGVTTGQTHWISALYDGKDIMGRRDNPVRREMDSVAKAAGLRFIVNVILDRHERIYRCVCGDPVEAHRAGCDASREIFGVPFGRYADIVVADSYPADCELWQAAKGIYSADLALAPGGTLILVTPCPDGVANGHPELSKIGYLPFAEIDALVRDRKIDDLTLAAHIAHVGRIVLDNGRRGILVSPGIDRATTERLHMEYAAPPSEALAAAFARHGRDARVTVVKNGGDMLPVYAPEKGGA